MARAEYSISVSQYYKAWGILFSVAQMIWSKIQFFEAWFLQNQCQFANFTRLKISLWNRRPYMHRNAPVAI